MALNNEVYDTGSSTLAKLHQYVDNQVSGNERAGLQDERAQFQRQVKASEYELSKANKGLEELGEINRQLQERLEHERARASSEKGALETEVQQLKQDIEKLKTNVHLEKRKREDMAKQRLQKNDNLYRKFEEKMLEQEKQIMKLKDQNEVMKMREKANKSLTVSDKIELGVSGQARDEAIVKLQEELKKRDQQMVDLNKKINKNKTSNAQLQGEKEKMQQDSKKVSDTNNRLVNDKLRQEETINKLNSELKNIKNEVYELRIDNKRHMAEKQGVGQGGGLSYKQLEEKLDE